MFSELFGLKPAVDSSDVFQFGARLGLDVLMTVVVIQGVYVRKRRNPEYEFTYYLFNIVTFSLCALLWQVRIEIGFALGLFGVFGILRYRAEQIRIRELTYLFVVIALAIVNAIAGGEVSLAQLVLIDVVIVSAVAAFDLRRHEERMPLTYDRIDLLCPGEEARLHEDIHARTGLAVARVDILGVDLLRETARLEVVIDPRRSSAPVRLDAGLGVYDSQSRRVGQGPQ